MNDLRFAACSRGDNYLQQFRVEPESDGAPSWVVEPIAATNSHSAQGMCAIDLLTHAPTKKAKVAATPPTLSISSPFFHHEPYASRVLAAPITNSERPASVAVTTRRCCSKPGRR